MRKHRSVLRLAVAQVQGLEARRLMAAAPSDDSFDQGHGGACDCAACSGPALTAALARNGADHDAAWYKPARTVVADSVGGDALPTYTTNAAGLPLLTSRPDGVGLKVFLDFDGNGSNLPFGIDADDTTFNAAEQDAIYQTWRDVASYFSAFNVNITTIQPPTGGTNPLFAWHLTSKSISGGYASVNSLTRTAPTGFNQAGDGVSRHSGIAHEVGHILGLSHQGEWDKLGVNVSEYTDGYGIRDSVLMGTDYVTNVRNWIYGRRSSGASSLQNDIALIAAKVATVTGGDGYRPDDFGNTEAAAFTVAANVQRIPGHIERQSDADVFKFTVTSAGDWHLDATPTWESSFAAELELSNSAGTIIASRDDADQRGGDNNDQAINIRLAPDTYYIRLTSSGDYAELGEYLLTVSPLMDGFQSTDVDELKIDRGGTASFDPATGVLTQMASGTDIAGTADQFRFTHDTLNGDGTIIARVTSLDDVDTGAKAGIMMRASLADNAAFVMIDVLPTGALQLIRRTTAGGNATIANTASPGPLPRWLRLVRVGNTFTASYSADGMAWTTLGSAASISMSPAIRVGFATTSQSSRESTFATYDNISLTGIRGETALTYNELPAPTDLVAAPAAGSNNNIALSWAAVAGATGYAIERSLDGVDFTRLANTLAAGVTTFLDTGLFGSMRRWYRVVALDGSIGSVPSDNASAVNKPSAPALLPSGYAVPAISPAAGNAIYLNWADVQGDQGYLVQRSTDGVNFTTTIGTTAANLNAINDTTAVANTAYIYRITPLTNVGDGIAPFLLINAGTRWTTSSFDIAARSSTSMVLTWTDFASETGYRIERTTNGVTGWTSVQTLPAGTTTWTDTNVTAMNEYYYRIVAVLPLGEITSASIAFGASRPATPLTGGWASSDVGAVGGEGSAGAVGSTFKVIGAGTSADQFHYLYKTITGDGSITVRVDSQKNNDIDDNAEAGIMIRNSLDATSPFAFVNVEPGRGGTFDFQTRSTIGGSTTNTAGPEDNAPVWFRLTKSGTSFTGEYSLNGTTWTVLATRTLTGISSTAPIYIGMAVTAIESNLMSNAVFSSVNVVGSNNAAPTTVTPATAATPTVTGTSTTLSVLGTDDAGEAALTYTWSTLSKPSAAATPIFSANGTNAAKATDATFFAPGSYTFRVTVTDAAGLSVTSDVTVDVSETLSSLAVSSGFSSVSPGSTLSFTAIGTSQFGTSVSLSNVTWSTSAGSIDEQGVLTALADAGPVTVTATSGSVSGSTDVTVRLVATDASLDVAVSPHRLSIDFNGNVSASLDNADFVVYRTDDGTEIPSTDFVVSFNPAANRATLTYAFGRLPDGRYAVEIKSSGVSVPSGQALFEPASFGFAFYAGDFNGDLSVNFDDLLILAQHYGSPGDYLDGDADYSGVVEFNDLLLLAQRYGSTLPAAAAPMAASTKAPTRRVRASDVLTTGQ